jgi:HlyD family secretion protein
MKAGKRPLFFAALLLVGAVSAGWVLMPEAIDEAEWTSVQREEFVMAVEVTGLLEAERSRLLGPPGISSIWNYKISFLAPEGMDVKEGQPVLGFDTSELDRALRDKRSEHARTVETLAKTMVSHEIADADLKLRSREATARMEKAALMVEVPESLVKRQELEEARLDLRLAEREREHLERRGAARARARKAEADFLIGKRDRAAARVQEIEESIAAMMVKAPVSGTVIHVAGRGPMSGGGQKKKVGDTCWRGEKVLQIPDLSVLRAEGEIDEADAGKIVVGQAVRLRLEAHPDEEFAGKVRSIRQTVSRRSRRDPVKVVRLDVELDHTDRKRMRPGMRFRGRIELERTKDLLLAPVDAVFSSPSGPVAFRRQWKGSERVPVELGRRNERWVEILSGLEDGDRISVRDGDAS